ncbi:hypothetical protein AAVH_40888 [Aphelenchoides avenae]|nr:hypothetical protein AAVH_40888 [Aphelenchus avenae]
MTQTPVATFHEGRWVVYKPRFTLVDGEEKAVPVKAGVEPDQKVVYIHNASGFHYSPIICVPQKQLYEVSAIVNHLGPTMMRGHYKTLLKMKRDWVVCNDETVETLDDEEELRDLYEPSGYVYFYSRSDVTISSWPRSTRRRRAKGRGNWA